MSKPYQPTKQWYHRNLPHWQIENAVYFVTIRLAGSLPQEVVTRLKDQRMIEEATLLQLGTSKEEVKNELKKIRHLYFGKFDELLDNSTTGPHFLTEQRYSEKVKSPFKYFDEQHYKLIAFTIMSNHAHLILYKLNRDLQVIMGSMKQFSSRQINIIRNTPGKKNWQEESYDHIIRDRLELAYYVSYILENPVKAGMVNHWKAWSHSYLRTGFEDFNQPQLLDT